MPGLNKLQNHVHREIKGIGVCTHSSGGRFAQQTSTVDNLQFKQFSSAYFCNLYQSWQRCVC